MNNFDIPSPVKKSIQARKAIKRAEDRYNEIVEGLSIFEPKVTERTTILCKKCGKRSQVKNVTFSRYYWYESPHGCMGGDMWHTNGFIVACPKCGQWERVHEPIKSLPLYEIQKIEYRVMCEILKFGQQCGDIYYKNGEYDCKTEIKWEH